MTNAGEKEDATVLAPSKIIRHAWRVLLFLALIATAATIYAVPWPVVLASIERADLRWLAGALLFYIAIAPVAATEWVLLTPNGHKPSWGLMLHVVTMVYAARNTLSFVGGEASVFVLLINKVKLNKTAAVSFMTLEQVLSGIGKAALIATAASLAPLPPALRSGATFFVWGMVGLCAGLAALTNSRVFLERLKAAAPSRLAGALRAVLEAIHSLDLLRSPRRIVYATALSLAQKLLELAAAACIQQACGLTPTPMSVVLVVTAVNVATIVPGPPANLGLYEGAAMLAYDYLGVSPVAALNAAVLQHVCYLLIAIGNGYALLGLRRLFK